MQGALMTEDLLPDVPSCATREKALETFAEDELGADT